MTKEKRKETDSLVPSKPCIGCIHWHVIEKPNNPEAVDLSAGSCDLNGYSKVSPVFTCNGWSDGNGKNL